MNKAALGMLVGGALGAIDGLSAWFSPDARPILVAIVVGSIVKGIVIPGMIVGALVGFVTQRYPRVSWVNRRVGAVFVLALAAVTHAAARQETKPQSSADPLTHLAPLIGRWVGTSDGQPGAGRVEREYSRALGSRFIRVTNRSVYPAQPKNPKGETHEDEGWFSYDRARNRVVFRQFHSEGFVNEYVEGGAPLTFETETIENIPPGWRARETYTFSSPNALEEVFELAEPGKDFEVYSRSRLTRAP